MNELTIAAGKKVAELIGAEAALVTAGGFSSMLLGTAACLTGTDMERIRALPNPTWPERNCLVQTPHRFSYDQAYEAAGANVVYVETRDELKASIDGNTAMLAAVSAVDRGWPIAPPRPLSRTRPTPPEVILPEELCSIGNQAGVPVMVDMASDLPPWENLHRYLEAGADLIVVSGGKGIGGPQSTGILAGRADLIEAARIQTAPNDFIGRGMKVGKEEIVALVVALERSMRIDQQAEMAVWEERATRLASMIKDIPGVTAVVALNNAGYADVDLSWDESVIPLSVPDVKRRLAEGDPKVVYDGTTVRSRLLRDGEERLVAQRLRAVFTEL